MRAYEASYYKDYDKNPKIVKYVLKKAILFFAEKIFPNDGVEFNKRIFISDFDSGTDYTIQRASEFLEKNKEFLPFLVYSIQETNVDEETQALGNKSISFGIFSEVLSRYIYSWPESTILRLSLFFSTPDDYYSCMQFFNLWKFSIHRIYAPYTFGILASEFYDNLKIMIKANLPVTLNIQSIEKGNFAFNFREFLNKSRIFDLTVNIQLKYTNYLFSDVFLGGEIEDIYLRLGRDCLVLEDNGSPLTILDTYLGENCFVIYFSDSMDYKTFMYSFEGFEGITTWNTNYTVLRFEGKINKGTSLLIPHYNRSLFSAVLGSNKTLDKDYRYDF